MPHRKDSVFSNLRLEMGAPVSPKMTYSTQPLQCVGAAPFDPGLGTLDNAQRLRYFSKQIRSPQ